MSTCRLYVAIKAPRAGFAKTRLSRAIGAEAALGLYRAFLADLANRFTQANLPLAWYVTPPDAWHELAPLLPCAARQAPVYAQGEGDWASRQQALFHDAASRGEQRVVLIGSDSPQLPVSTVRTAFRLLARHEIVLGPVHDGGYNLIGMRGCHDVLQGVAMSTGVELNDILTRARAARLSVRLLPPTFDIDEVEDLRHLDAVLHGRHDMPATATALRAFDLAESIDQPTVSSSAAAD